MHTHITFTLHQHQQYASGQAYQSNRLEHTGKQFLVDKIVFDQENVNGLQGGRRRWEGGLSGLWRRRRARCATPTSTAAPTETRRAAGYGPSGLRWRRARAWRSRRTARARPLTVMRVTGVQVREARRLGGRGGARLQAMGIALALLRGRRHGAWGRLLPGGHG